MEIKRADREGGWNEVKMRGRNWGFLHLQTHSDNRSNKLKEI